MSTDRVVFPKIGEGSWADASNDQYSLRLFSSVTELGWAAGVYDLKGHNWVAREWADNEEDGRQKALAIAEYFLKALPAIDWKKCG
jgi:hypothetical protein